MALSGEAFWSLTPRELMALRAIQDAEREEVSQMWAGLMAAIHNAWLRGKGRRPYKPSDFLRSAEPQTWQDKQQMLRTMLTVAGSHLPKIEPPPRAA